MPSRRDRTFRIFVSSTFVDFEHERNALHDGAFRNLRRFCRERGAQFQVIDLRWGVREEAALDQQTMNICLRELKRCSNISPAPSFITLLGNRYGWRPLPAQIRADEVEQLTSQMGEHGIELFRQWYSRDDNAIPEEYVLQAREGVFVDAQRWNEVESQLHEVLRMAAEKVSSVASLDLTKYTYSATHQEILQEALQSDVNGHAFAYLRNIEDLPDDGSAKNFRDMRNGLVDRAAESRLSVLKAALKDALPSECIFEFSARWRDGALISPIQALSDRVERDLRGVIQSELDSLDSHAFELVASQDDAGSGADSHQQFCTARRDIAELREKYWSSFANTAKRVEQYLSRPATAPFIVFEQQGASATDCVALSYLRAHARHSSALVIPHFPGADPNSTDWWSFLNGLLQKMGEEDLSDQIDSTFRETEIHARFLRRVQSGSAVAPLMLFLGGLRQLDDWASIRSTRCLPTVLPADVHIVAAVTLDCDLNATPATPSGSALSIHQLSDILDGIEALLPPDNKVYLPYEDAALERITERLDFTMRTDGRRLQPDQKSALVRPLRRAVLTPLYLRVFESFTYEQAKRWRSYERVPEYVEVSDFGGDVSSLLAGFVSSLSREHNECLVSRYLGYILVSRRGLSEEELIDILSCDVDVYAEFFRSSFHCPPDLRAAICEHLGQDSSEIQEARSLHAASQARVDELREDSEALGHFLKSILPNPEGPKLPAAVWLGLGYDLEPYVSEREEYGIVLKGLFHRQLAEFLKDDFFSLSDRIELHKGVLSYFERQPPLVTRRGQQVPNERRSFEIEFQRESLAASQHGEDE